MMMQRIVIALGLTLTIHSAWATNGYIPYGFGTKSKGMAGVGVALPLDTMGAAVNPASMVLLGERLDLGAALFAPSRSYTAHDDASFGYPAFATGTFDSDKDYFLIPHVGYNYMLDKQSSIGISIAGIGGMNTEYPYDVFSAFNPRFPPNTPDTSLIGQPIPNMPTASSPAGVNLMQLFVGVTYARQLNAVHNVGITPIFAVQRFKAYGLEPFMGVSAYPNQVTNNGYDESYGGGVRIGWLGQFNEQWSVGASYQTRLWMSKLEEYKGLFANGGEFDVPPHLTLGVAYQATPALTLAFDIQHIFYSDIDAVANTHATYLTDANYNPVTVLGTEDGLGFGWDDMTVAKLGVAWQLRPDFTVRAGYSHANQVIPSSEGLFNIIAPAVIQDHWTLGFTSQINAANELNFSFAYMPTEHVCGTNVNTGNQSGCIQMNQYELELSWGLRF